MGVVRWRLFAPITQISYIGVDPRQPQISGGLCVQLYTARGCALHRLKRSEPSLKPVPNNPQAARIIGISENLGF